MLVRWPGRIPAGVEINDIIQHHDRLPTFLAAAGEPDIVEKLKKGHQAGDKTFKVHIVRFDNWKVVFMEQRMPGTLAVWAEPFVALRLPKLFNLRLDPYERAT